jgi:CheY-like chemotaxis protein
MTSNALRILLVEDDELFRLGLSMRLQQEPGLEVVAEVEDGETAIELALQKPLDIVLLDIGLPGIGGIETCEQLKQQCPELPILALTSRFQKPLIAKLIEVGVKGYCLKGIKAELLIWRCVLWQGELPGGTKQQPRRFNLLLCRAHNLLLPHQRLKNSLKIRSRGANRKFWQ